MGSEATLEFSLNGLNYTVGPANVIVIAEQSLSIDKPDASIVATIFTGAEQVIGGPKTHTLRIPTPAVPGVFNNIAIDGTTTQQLREVTSTVKTTSSDKSPSVPQTSTKNPSAPNASTASSGTTAGTRSSPPTKPSKSSTDSSAEGQSSTSSPKAGSSPSNGLSKGATAGIGVGCAIAGALIAAILVFLLMRRKRRGRPSRSYPLVEKPATLSQPNGSMKAAIPTSSAFAIAESSLPLPLEDAAVGGEMSKLQTLIKNYAQSYYHTSTVAGKTPDLSALGQLSIPMATLAAMLKDPRTRLVAIRYCVAWTIFSRIGLNTDASMSLLPPEVAGCTRPISADTASKNYIPSLASWRALTHSLLSSTYPASSLAPLNAASLQAAVSTLDTVLQPYADTNRDSYERMTKLEEILKRGGKFGWTLFGQISSFDFDWERGTRGEVGIFPALVQATDEKGERVKGRGRVLWEGEGTRVEGL